MSESGSALASVGYDPRLRSLFIWSGVSFYLSADAVGEVFDYVRASSPPGSSLVFDYHYQGFTDGSRDYYGSAQAKRRVEALGEPCIFGIDEGAVAALLQRHGLELVSDFGPAELEARYLVGGDGRVAGHPFGFVSIAHARIPKLADHPGRSARAGSFRLGAGRALWCAVGA